MGRRAAVALLALIFAAVTGCGGGAGGDDNSGGSKSNDPFYGVISAEPLPDESQLTTLGDGGVGTLRINLAWGTVQSSRDAPYDWSHYDPVIANAARAGVRVLATVYSSPTWAEENPETPPLGSSLPDFRAFVRAAAIRYGVGGTFWKLNPDIPELPITDWQVWNEPNSPLFWKPTPNSGEYLTLLRAFRSAVKDVDPSAQVMVGGLFPTPTGGISMARFLGELYEGGGRGQFDSVAIHPYASTPRIALARVANERRITERFGDPDVPIWITEVGWASDGRPPGLVVGPQRQADYLRQIFQLARENRNRLGIAGVVWYSLKDTPGPLWVGHCGLFSLSGVPKPAFEALTSVAGSGG